MSRQYDNRGRDQNNFENVGSVIFCEQEKPTRPRNEQILLEEVRDNVISSRAQSLYRAVLISLGKESQPNQVTQPWKRELRIGLNPATPIPAEQTIAQIFDDPAITGKLLILGQPGAGKTTALLELAKTLVERAQDDINQPIPVILSLSNWQDEKQPIRDWIILQLSKRYEANCVSQWLSDRKLLPLLDGLDEVASERQVSCVNSINEFLNSQSSPLYVAVCSRSEEYENLANRLQLNGAVYLKALEDEQIEDYLTQLERPLLWKEISQNEDLLTLVRSPLLLNIMLLTYPEDSGDTLKQLQGSNNLLNFLLDAYIEQKLNEQLGSPAYSKGNPPVEAKTITWLNWLSRQMAKQSQTEFLIEDLQPSMLPNKHRYLYLAFFGVIVSLCYGLAQGISAMRRELLVGFGILVLFWLSRGQIRPLEKLKWPWQPLLLNKFSLMIFAVIVIVAVVIRLVMREGESNKILIAVPTVFMGYLLGGLLTNIKGETVEQKLIPNQGIKQSAKNAATVGLFVGLFNILISALSFAYDDFSIFPFLGMTDKKAIWLVWTLITGAISGLLGGLMRGGKACIQHLALRFILYQSQKAPWNYARFLDYCTERRLLQRVGGRYRFIHKYLQDHFANMPLEQPKD